MNGIYKDEDILIIKTFLENKNTMRTSLAVLCICAASASATTQTAHTHSQQYDHADPWKVNRKEIEFKKDIMTALDEKC